MNTFDFYQEGFWSPSVTAQSGQNLNPTLNDYVYTKMGRVIHAEVRFTIGTLVGSGIIVVSGLPYIANWDTVVSINMNNAGSGYTGTFVPWAYLAAGQATMYIYGWGASIGIFAIMPYVKVGTEFRMNVTYHAAG